MIALGSAPSSLAMSGRSTGPARLRPWEAHCWPWGCGGVFRRPVRFPIPASYFTIRATGLCSSVTVCRPTPRTRSDRRRAGKRTVHEPIFQGKPSLKSQSLICLSKICLSKDQTNAQLAELRIDNSSNPPTLIGVVRAPWIIQPASCARLQSEVQRAVGQPVILHIWTVQTRECNAQGFLWEKSLPDQAVPDQTVGPTLGGDAGGSTGETKGGKTGAGKTSGEGFSTGSQMKNKSMKANE